MLTVSLTQLCGMSLLLAAVGRDRHHYRQHYRNQSQEDKDRKNALQCTAR